jgi:hypothetical protein
MTSFRGQAGWAKNAVNCGQANSTNVPLDQKSKPTYLSKTQDHIIWSKGIWLTGIWLAFGWHLADKHLADTSKMVHCLTSFILYFVRQMSICQMVFDRKARNSIF